MKKATHILLIDDDEDDRMLFREALTEMSLLTDFSEAINGEDALLILQSSSWVLPDLIFLDLNMPKMNGKTLLTALKKDDILKDIPVIILTTSTEESDKKESLTLGAKSFVTKPTEFMDLCKLIHSFLA